MTLLREALRQNASWVALVCAAHGVATSDDGRLLVAASPPPAFFPHAMTLAVDVTADELAGAVAGRDRCGVKDSFAAVDLRPHGFSELFAATWLALDGEPDVAPVGAVRRVPAPVDDPDVVSLEVAVDGRVTGTGVAHRATGAAGLREVLGLQDVGAADPGTLAALVAGARVHLGDLPVVGYERGDDLATARAAGFVGLGPLRVWVR